MIRHLNLIMLACAAIISACGTGGDAKHFEINPRESASSVDDDSTTLAGSKNGVDKGKVTDASLKGIESEGLLFALTFNDGKTSADFSIGTASPLNGAGLEPTKIYDAGHDGRGAVNINTRDGLKYSAVRNINACEGSLLFWFKAVDYAPMDTSHHQVEPQSHKAYVHINLQDPSGSKSVEMFLYQYFNQPTLSFYWKSSSPDPQMATDFQYLATGLNTTKQGEWVHIGATWNETVMRLFINGELQKTLPFTEAMLKDVRGLVVDDKKSHIGIRTKLFPPYDDAQNTVIDDVLVYDYDLTTPQMHRCYLGSKTGHLSVKSEQVECDFAGLDTRENKVLDVVEASFSYKGLGKTWRDAIRSGNVTAKVGIETPGGEQLNKEWRVQNLTEVVNIPGIATAGIYNVRLVLRDATGRDFVQESRFTRPDTRWFRNDLGKVTTTIPSPWSSPVLSKELRGRVVTVWGREYVFGSGPLPIEVIHQGDSLLAEAPTLQISGENGPEAITYELTSETVDPARVTMEGIGRAGSFTIRWKTYIEFDGLIRFDFIIDGSPVISDMRLTWKVREAYSGYLMTPTLKGEGQAMYECAFPGAGSGWRNDECIWLSSDTKGFAWIPEHDANWVYANKMAKPIRVASENGGRRVVLNMIGKSVKMPPSTPYHAMFMATPARPLPHHNRTYNLSGHLITASSRVNLVQTRGEGMEGVFSLKPSDKFGMVMDNYRTRGFKRLAIYDSSTGLNDYLLEGRYFFKSWELPGVFGPTFYDPTIGKRVTELDCCPLTSFTDLKLFNLKHLLEHPQEMYAMIYYDLTVVWQCANRKHGCHFSDRFGRDIVTLYVMGLRDMLMRSMVLCHAKDKDLIVHGWSQFNPASHHFSDYWFPGEQYMEKIQANNNPYYYSDGISDAEYRAELSQRNKGTSTIFLPNLKRAKATYGDREQTMAMCTKLLLNDIQMMNHFSDKDAIEKIWQVQARYSIEDAIAHLYHEQSAIVSDNTGISITYYDCVGGKTLAVIGNTTKLKQVVNVDASGMKRSNIGSVTDEISGTTLPVTDGRFRLIIPARLFTMVGF